MKHLYVVCFLESASCNFFFFVNHFLAFFLPRNRSSRFATHTKKNVKYMKHKLVIFSIFGFEKKKKNRNKIRGC